MIAVYVILAVIVLLLAWVAGAYNGLVSARNQAEEAFSGIDVQLRRRYDLIPNLVETVKGYAKHEEGVLESVTQARAAAVAGTGSQSLEQKAQNEQQLTQALRSVFAVAENYPDLKASDNFQQLSAQLSETEDKLEAARRFYNATVRDYNTRLQSFPVNLIAGSFGFIAKELFVLDDAEAKQPVKVDFSK